MSAAEARNIQDVKNETANREPEEKKGKRRDEEFNPAEIMEISHKWLRARSDQERQALVDSKRPVIVAGVLGQRSLERVALPMLSRAEHRVEETTLGSIGLTVAKAGGFAAACYGAYRGVKAVYSWFTSI